VPFQPKHIMDQGTLGKIEIKSGRKN